MKTLLVVTGILLLLLGLVLLVIALVLYFVGRNKRPAGTGAQPVPPQRPAYPAQGVPPQMAQAPPGAPPQQQPGQQQPPRVPPPPPPPPPAAVPRPAAPQVPPRPPEAPPAPPQASAPVASDVEATVIAGLGFGALHAVSGPLAGQTFPLKMDGFYIGRDRTLSQVVIELPSVSKRHVWVGVREGVVTAIDQSSTNGTYLNALGTRIGETRLTPGDVLILSDDVARFVYRG